MNKFIQWAAAGCALFGMMLLSESFLMAGFIVTFFGCFFGLIFAYKNKIWAYVVLDIIMGISAINGLIGLMS